MNKSTDPIKAESTLPTLSPIDALMARLNEKQVKKGRTGGAFGGKSRHNHVKVSKRR